MTKKLFFFVLASGLLMAFVCAGCLKNGIINPNPITEIPVPPIYLKIVDSTTGQDLFAGADPTYTLNEIRIYFNAGQASDTSQYQPFGLDSTKNCLVTYPAIPFLLLKIADLPVDTLTIISSKKLKDSYEFIDSIIINGQKYAADNQQIFTIKK